jgi:hypothetical protein
MTTEEVLEKVNMNNECTGDKEDAIIIQVKQKPT